MNVVAERQICYNSALSSMTDRAARSPLPFPVSFPPAASGAKSHLGFFLYPVFWVAKKRGRRYLSAIEDLEKTIVRSITAASSHPLKHKLMELEAALRSRLHYPFWNS